MSGGGKGASNQTVAYYFAPVAFAVCEGPIAGIKKIWAGGNLIFSDNEPVAVNTYQGGGKKSGPTVSTSYQQFSSSTQNDIQTGGSALGPWTCYLGTVTQLADPTIGEGVAYRGVAYIVFNPLNIGPGATIPPLTFEVVTAGKLNPPSVVWNCPRPVSAGGLSLDMDRGNYCLPAFDDYGDLAFGAQTSGSPGSDPYWIKLSNATGKPSFIPSGTGGLSNPIMTFGGTSAPGYAIEYPTFANGFDGLNGAFLEFDSTTGVFTYRYYDIGPSGPPYSLVGDGRYIYFTGLNHLHTFEMSTGITTRTLYGGFNFTQACAINGIWYASRYGGLLQYKVGSGIISTLFSGYIVNAVAEFNGGLVLSATLNNSTNTYLIFTDDTGNETSRSPQLPGGSTYSGFIIVIGGSIWVSSGDGLGKFSPSGTLLASVTAPTSVTFNWGVYYNGFIYAGGVGNFCTKINPGGNTVLPTAVTLPEVVTTLCERAGLTQFDVSLLPPIAVNFVRGDTVTARSMLTRLSQAYFFSMVDSAGTLRFIPQGQPSQGVIPLEDLGYGKISANAQTPYTASRISGVDLPRSIRIRYISAALNWNKYEQVFALESYESGKEITLDLPLILDDQTAYNIAALACTLPHAERMQFAFTTSYKWLAIEPGDVVTLPFGTCRILTVKMGQKGGIPVIDFTCCIDGMNALAGAGYAEPGLPNYQPNTGGLTALLAAPANLATVHTPSSASPHPIATAPQIVQTVPNAGVSKMVLVEPPPLKQSDTGMRFMMGAYSTGNTFPGAGIFESTDGGNTYSQLATEISATSAGYANTTLGVPSASEGFYTWDTQNTVDIYMLGNGADPAPATDLQVMNGFNGAMLGQELIQFAQATLMTDSLGNEFYRLSRLLRGRRGTEWAMGTHQVGESFYLVPSMLTKEPYTPTQLNNPTLYKVTMIGGDLGNAPAISYEPNGNSLRQWAVCHPAVSLDSSNDWTVSWVPRARYNGDWASGYIPTLDSDTAGWSIDVLSGTTVKRTIQVPLQQTGPWQSVYTAAMQSADGFAAGQSGIIFNIYQLSSSVGRGVLRSITTP
jgi:hypothetical protein